MDPKDFERILQLSARAILYRDLLGLGEDQPLKMYAQMIAHPAFAWSADVEIWFRLYNEWISMSGKGDKKT